MKRVKCLILVGLLVLFVGGTAAYAADVADGGAFSAYLIGVWEKRNGFGTILSIINPTTEKVNVVIAFYNQQGDFLVCEKIKGLKPNAMFEVTKINLPHDKQNETHGAVKIISYDDKNKPKRGIVGFQRHCKEFRGCSDAVLASVPTSLAEGELAKISSDGCTL